MLLQSDERLCMLIPIDIIHSRSARSSRSSEPARRSLARPLANEAPLRLFGANVR